MFMCIYVTLLSTFLDLLCLEIWVNLYMWHLLMDLAHNLHNVFYDMTFILPIIFMHTTNYVMNTEHVKIYI